LLNQLKQEYANSDYSDTARGIYNQAVEDVRVEGKKNAIQWVKEVRETDIFSENEQRTLIGNYNVQKYIMRHFELSEEEIQE